MIITDITQIDNMAERMFRQTPNLIVVDINDYNRVKRNSTVLNAASVKLMFALKDGINIFIDTIQKFRKQDAHQVLLHISGVRGSLETENITLNEINVILGVIEEYFGNVDIIWGLSDRKDVDTNSYEINVIVGYKS